jgi:hypothetical protein
MNGLAAAFVFAGGVTVTLGVLLLVQRARER